MTNSVTRPPTRITPAAGPTQDFEDDSPSLDVLHEQAEWALDRAHERADGIDAKTGAILTTSGLLIAGVTVLQSAISSHVGALPPGAPAPWWEIAARVLTGVTAVSFVAVLVLCIITMWPRDYTIAPSPTQLRKKYLGRHEKITKVVVMNERVKAYKPTMKTVDRKARYMTGAFIALGVEGGILAIILMIAAIAL